MTYPECWESEQKYKEIGKIAQENVYVNIGCDSVRLRQ